MVVSSCVAIVGWMPFDHFVAGTKLEIYSDVWLGRGCWGEALPALPPNTPNNKLLVLFPEMALRNGDG